MVIRNNRNAGDWGVGNASSWGTGTGIVTTATATSSWKTPRGGASASLATRIKCSRGEWKNRDQFSNKNLTEFGRLVEAGIATAENSHVLCREHTSNQITEMQCRNCHQIMALHHFSKSTRRNKKYICKDCVSYHTADLELNLPPPNAQLSSDEIAAAQQSYQDIESFEDCRVPPITPSQNPFDNYGGKDDDDEGDYDPYEDSGDESDNITWDHESSIDTESQSGGYESDCSEGTVRPGLGSNAYSASHAEAYTPQLNEFSVPNHSKTTGSYVSFFSSARSNTGSSAYSSTKTTSTTSSGKTNLISAREEKERNSKWAKRGRKSDINVPDYVRTRVWTDDNVPTPRELDYESDDSL